MDKIETYRIDRRFLYWVERLSDEQFVALLLTPTAILLAAIAFYPLLRTINMSMHADSLFEQAALGEFVFLQNYIDIFTGDLQTMMPRPFFDLSSPLQSALIVTIVFTVVSVVCEAILGVTMAIFLNETFRGRGVIRTIILLPWAVPIAVHGMIFYLLFTPGVGFAADWLNQLGLVSSAPLASSGDALLLIITADIWKTTPFIALIVLAGLQTIDRDLYRVGKVAGASRWQRFREITVPLLMPALLVALLFRTIQALKVYGIIEIMAGCNTVPSLSCMVVSTFQQRFWGTSSTLAVFTALVVGVFVSIYLLWFREEGI